MKSEIRKNLRFVNLNKRTTENNSHSNIIDESIEEISSWRIDNKKYKKAVLLYFLTFGILYLIVRIWKKLYLSLNCVPCEPINADYFLVIDECSRTYVFKSIKENFYVKNELLRIYKFNSNFDERKISKDKLVNSSYIGAEFYNYREETTVLYFRKNKYIFIEGKNAFESIKFDISIFHNQEIYKRFLRGMRSIEEYNYLLNKFGRNLLQMEEKKLFKIINENILSPLYIYQIFSITIWLFQSYVVFGLVVIICNIIILLLTSIHSYNIYNQISKLNKYIPAEVNRDFDFVNLVKEQTNINKNNPNLIEDFNLNKSIENNEKEIKIETSNISDSESLHIVPGDILNIQSGESVPCDCIILNGACTVNESDLTGESILLMKSSLPNDSRDFNYELNKKSFLFQGTTVNKTESSHNEGTLTVMAINTGFSTNRGNLLQNLLFSKKTNFKFYEDLKKFFFIMGIIWIIAAVCLILIYINQNKPKWSLSELILKIFDLLTVILPPSLNICLSFISFYFHYNLNKKNISCIDNNKINVAGRANIIIFDKTGTLTEEGLDIHGFQTTILKNQNNNNTFTRKKLIEFDDIKIDTRMYHSIHQEFWRRFCNDPASYQDYQNNIQNNIIFYLECLATCHSIDKLKEDSLGNSLDKRIFDYLYWTQEKYNNEANKNDSSFNSDNTQEKSNMKYDMIPKNSYKITGESILKNNKNIKNSGKRYKLTIVKRFEFSSKFQSNSVIVRNCLDDSYRFFIKGAPEKIIKICNRSSLPASFNEKLMEHTKNGFRVLACATKLLPTPQMENKFGSHSDLDSDYYLEEDRTFYEKNLIFLGFIIFKNKLKKDTKNVISNLKKSNYKLIMATGDNPFTSISVAKECEMFDYEKNIFLFDMEKQNYEDEEQIKITQLVIDINNRIKTKDKKELIKLNLKKNQLEKNSKKIQLKNPISSSVNSIISEIKLLSINNSNHTVNDTNNFGSNLISGPIPIKGIGTYSNPIKGVNNCLANSEQIRNVLELKTFNSDKEFQSIVQKIISTNSYICLSGRAFEYLLINYKEEIIKNTVNYEKSYIFSQVMGLIKENGKIFFSMNPNDKVELVNFFKEDKNNIVAMCGDGANDCGALLRADIGISIRIREGNNFVNSHFYSFDESISCVEIIIRNGRACFENSIIILKFMIMYAIIQLTTILILYSLKRDLNPSQWLYIDLFVVLVSCFLASKTGAGYNLSSVNFTNSIMNFNFLSCIIGQAIIQVSLQFLFFYILKYYRSTMSNRNPDIFDSVKLFYLLFIVFVYI